MYGTTDCRGIPTACVCVKERKGQKCFHNRNKTERFRLLATRVRSFHSLTRAMLKVVRGVWCMGKGKRAHLKNGSNSDNFPSTSSGSKWEGGLLGECRKDCVFILPGRLCFPCPHRASVGSEPAQARPIVSFTTFLSMHCYIGLVNESGRY